MSKKVELSDEIKRNMECMLRRQLDEQQKRSKSDGQEMRPRGQEGPDGNNDAKSIMFGETSRDMTALRSQSLALDDVSAENKREKNRTLTIQELIQTETDYYVEIKSCYDAFMLDDASRESPIAPPNDFNRNALFGRLKPIIDVSKSLLDSFDAELKSNDNNILKMRVSSCLIKLAPDMRIPYAEYARAHNEISSLVKKYEENPIFQEYIKSRLSEKKDKIRVPQLATILIKPVQRIFKYPLFLTRLSEVTGKSDPDYAGINQALTLFTEMLEFINEFKRRKDLVDKYLHTDQSDLSLIDLMKKINMKSIRKKKNRFSLQISKQLGLSSTQISDENFLRIEANYRFIEKSIKHFVADLNSFLSSFKEVLDYEKDMFNDMLFIFEDEFQLYSKFELASNSRRSVDYQKYSAQVIQHVLTPLNALVNCFNGPNKLISKRNDKLLDYEGALTLVQSGSTASTSKDTLVLNMEQARKNYEALNYQLIEELPLLTQTSTKILLLGAKCFIKITNRFFNLITTSIKKVLDETQFDQYCQEHLFDENRRVSQLIRVRTINEKFDRSGSIMLASTSSSNRQSQQPSPLTTPNRLFEISHNRQQRSASLLVPNGSGSFIFEFKNNGVDEVTSRPQSTLLAQDAPIQSEEQRQKLISKYPSSELYVVTQKYIANEKLCRLKTNINDLLGLIKPYDPAQQTHIWFVDNGDVKGFVPASALTPYNQLYNNSNLIKFEDEENKNKSNRNSQTPHNHNQNILIDLENHKSDGESPSELPPPPPTPQYCVAMYNLKALTANMIDLVKNQKYRVLEKCDKRGDEQWWLLESTVNGLKGYVPKSYVKIL